MNDLEVDNKVENAPYLKKEKFLFKINMKSNVTVVHRHNLDLVMYLMGFGGLFVGLYCMTMMFIHSIVSR